MTAGGRTPEQVAAAMAAAARLAPYRHRGDLGRRALRDRPRRRDGAFAGRCPRPRAARGAGRRVRRTRRAPRDVAGADPPHVARGDPRHRPRSPRCRTASSRTRPSTPRRHPRCCRRARRLRGGKDAFGNERRYVTLDALTAHGAALTGVRSFAPGEPVRAHGVAAVAPDFPLRPSAGPEAAHSLRIHSPALAFDAGDLTAEVSFTGAAGAEGLSALVWRWSRADGTTSGTTAAPFPVGTVTVTLTGGCGARDGEALGSRASSRRARRCLWASRSPGSRCA